MGTQTDWLLLTLCWLLGLGALYGQARPLVVETQFTTSSVNDRVWVLKRPLLPPRLVHPARPPAGFWPNPDRDLVRIGAAYQRPQAWLYLPLINPTARPRRLIVDVEHNRCDTLEGFLVRAGQCIKLGSLCRGLPLLQRPLPLRDYALPFTLAPHDTVALLLRSCRTTGGHELNLALSTPAQYLLKRDQEGSLRLLGLGCAFFFTTTVLALGGLFGQRLLIYFGLFGFCLSVGQLNYNYYFDSVPFPAGLGLNANSDGALYHLSGQRLLSSLRAGLHPAASPTAALASLCHRRTGSGQRVSHEPFADASDPPDQCRPDQRQLAAEYAQYRLAILHGRAGPGSEAGNLPGADGHSGTRAAALPHLSPANVFVELRLLSALLLPTAVWRLDRSPTAKRV